jgi:hypothetical protein
MGGWFGPMRIKGITAIEDGWGLHEESRCVAKEAAEKHRNLKVARTKKLKTGNPKNTKSIPDTTILYHFWSWGFSFFCFSFAFFLAFFDRMPNSRS